MVSVLATNGLEPTSETQTFNLHSNLLSVVFFTVHGVGVSLGQSE